MRENVGMEKKEMKNRNNSYINENIAIYEKAQGKTRRNETNELHTTCALIAYMTQNK